MQRSLIISLLAALLLVVFALRNSIPVELDFIIGNPVKGSLSLILLLTLIIGVFVGLLISYPTFKKLKKNISDSKVENIKLTDILDEFKKEYGIHKNKDNDKDYNNHTEKK